MGDVLEVSRKSGEVSFKARVRRRGEPLLTKTFKRKSDALKWIGYVEAQLLEGKGLPRPKRHTVAEAIDRYIEEILPQKKASTQRVEKPRLLFWKDRLGTKRLAEVDRDALSDARKHLLDTQVWRKGATKGQSRGNATANRFFALLRHVYSVCVRDWEWSDDNQVSKIRALREPKGRNRTLSDDELKKILVALETHERKDFRLIVQIALVTGCRRGNAQSIHYEHVDFERPTVTFPDTKNNLPHVAPITRELADEIKAYVSLAKIEAGPLFPSKEGSRMPYVDVKQVWRTFASDNELEKLRFHDLRHAVGSYLAQQNVPLITIGKLLGHKSLESTKRYVHLGVEEMTQPVEQLGARLRRVK
jgi:integrase